MSLIDDVRDSTRTVTTKMDGEIISHVAAALSDMRRAGVREELLDPDALHPMVKEAVFLYTKAHYGYDNSEAQRFLDSYTSTVSALLNSDHNECADENPRQEYAMSIVQILESL